MRPHIFAALLVVGPAWLMMPLQEQIHSERQQLKYGGESVTRELRDQIGQGLAIALLAGFRGVVADFIWIRSHSCWEQGLWYKLAESIENTVKLQPQSTLFWDVGAWHMAWNIGYAERVATNNTTVAEGISRERFWHQRARGFLERGVQNVPNRFDLYYKLGWLYEQKLAQDCGSDADCQKEQYAKAAGYLSKAASFDDAPGFIARDAARCIERSGNAKGAYEYWLNLWKRKDSPRDAYARPIMEHEIRRIEDNLKMPDNIRCFPSAQL